MANRKVLGKGLRALIPDTTSEHEDSGSIQFIQIEKISPNPFQPREKFNPETLAELRNSIAEKGLVQPITVRRYNDGYQLISGERRLRAVRELEIESIPAYILDVHSDEDMLELSIIENIHREDLNPIEIANGYKRLIDECHLTQEEAALKVGKDRTTVTNFLRLLKLPVPIQDSMQKGDISMGHARALLSVLNPDDQIVLWKKILSDNLSVRRIEDLVRNVGKKPPSKSAAPQPANLYFQEAESKLRQKLTTKAIIKSRGKGGCIEIEYYSDDDLERVVALICGD
jgi:ParB family chromosome partitioning protein